MGSYSTWQASYYCIRCCYSFKRLLAAN